MSKKSLIYDRLMFVWFKKHNFHHYYLGSNKKTLCGILMKEESLPMSPMDQMNSTACLRCLNLRIKNLIRIRDKIKKEKK